MACFCYYVSICSMVILNSELIKWNFKFDEIFVLHCYYFSFPLVKFIISVFWLFPENFCFLLEERLYPFSQYQFIFLGTSPQDLDLLLCNGILRILSHIQGEVFCENSQRLLAIIFVLQIHVCFTHKAYLRLLIVSNFEAMKTDINILKDEIVKLKKRLQFSQEVPGRKIKQVEY